MNVPGVTVIVPAPFVINIELPTPVLISVDLPTPIVVVLATAGAQGPPGNTGLQGPTGSQGALGPQGIQGPGGASGAGYVYTQTIAALVWTVVHDLGFFPSVAVFSSGGVAVLADVAHLSLSTLTITFVIPFVGFARLS